jgi:hypothetical protein
LKEEWNRIKKKLFAKGNTWEHKNRSKYWNVRWKKKYSQRTKSDPMTGTWNGSHSPHWRTDPILKGESHCAKI